MTDKPVENVATAPDPEEDDLDDLDDVLDEFSAKSKPAPVPSTSASTSIPSHSGPGRPVDAASPSQIPSQQDDELAQQLQSGMENLMGELDANPQMQKEFERMMQELIAAGAAPTDADAAKHIGKATEAITHSAPSAGSRDTAAKTSSSGGGQDSFQDTIRKTMERMQASGEQASAAAAAEEGSEEDLLAQMMKELGASGGDGEEDFNKMLMGMMSQLTHKEILYEPMKDLHDKFPGWMREHEGKVGQEDLERYRQQQILVGEIVARFERSAYSDENEGDREYIVERMQKMQAQGSPPPDLVGDLPAAQEAMGDLEGGCPTQ